MAVNMSSTTVTTTPTIAEIMPVMREMMTPCVASNNVSHFQFATRPVWPATHHDEKLGYSTTMRARCLGKGVVWVSGAQVLMGASDVVCLGARRTRRAPFILILVVDMVLDTRLCAPPQGDNDLWRRHTGLMLTSRRTSYSLLRPRSDVEDADEDNDYTSMGCLSARLHETPMLRHWVEPPAGVLD